MTSATEVSHPQHRPARASHIAILMGSYNGRGVQRVFLNLAPELIRRGHTVTLLVCRSEGRLRAEPSGNLRAVTLTPRVPSEPQLLPLLHYCLATSGTPYVSRISALLEFIANERPDVVVSGGTRCNLLNSMARHVSSAPFRAVLTEHNPLSSKVKRRSRRWKLRSVRGLYRHADAVAGVSSGVAAELERHLHRPGPALPNPVLTARFQRQRAAPPPHPWLMAAKDGGPPVVVAVGALEPRKNFGMLLDAFAKLRATRRARLIVLGDGPQRGALVETARSLGIDADVELAGFVPVVAPYLASASVLALTSTYEGFGCVIVEALACGCPVVSTDCPYGPREILVGGRYGTLVEPDDIDGFADALARTLDAVPDGRALETRARAFSVGTAADAYLALMFPEERVPCTTRSKTSS
jgi:glycosyltransferase involved in cell wall biosynthesis